MKTFLYVLDKQTEREPFWWSAEKCSKGAHPSEKDILKLVTTLIANTKGARPDRA